MKKFILLVGILAIMLGLFAEEVVIGTETSFLNRFPLGSWKDYERSAAIYTADEIGPQNTSISALSWYSQSATTIAVPTKIYMKTTDASTLTPDTWANMISGATLHYDQIQTGTVANGWNLFTLDSDFEVAQGENLMILVERNVGDGTNGGMFGAWVHYTDTVSTHMEWAANSAPPTGNGTVSSKRPNVTLTYTVFSFDRPPHPATLDSPADGATQIATSSTLSWIAPSNPAPTAYTLYLGTDNPPTNIVDGTDLGDVLSYNFADLDHSTTHYWQIVPSNSYGAATDCPVWSFTTDTPPNPATVSSPADGAIYVLTNSSLNWNVPEGSAPTGYKLYLGTDNPPTNIVNATDLGDLLSYDFVGLEYSTTHYWQVVPYNAYGDASECPVWSFTTIGLPLRGVKTIDPAGSGADNFTSFTEALAILSLAGVGQDGVVFNVPAGLTFNETEALAALSVTGTLQNPISFVKSGTGANPVVTIPGTAGSSDYVFKLAGVDYITFDGIDISNAPGMTNLEYGYWLVDTAVGGGSSNNVIKNCVITLDRVNSNSTGVYAEATSSQNNNNLYKNITVNNAQKGVRLTGMSNMADENNVIDGCTFNAMGNHSIHVYYQTNMDILDNLINYPMSSDNVSFILYGMECYELTNSSVYNNTLSGGNVSGILWNMLFNVSGEIEVHHNTISGVATTGSNYIGIYVSLPSWGTVNIHHNDIYDIDAVSAATCWPIYTMRAYDLNINDNHIHNIRTGNTFRGIHTIENRSLDNSANIYNNHIHDIELMGQNVQMAAAISVNDVYANVYNNMVYDIKAPNVDTDEGIQIVGISMQDNQPAQGERASVYNNSILLDVEGAGNNTTSCFYTTFAGPVDLKNNIFSNHSNPGANGKAVAFWKTAATFDNFVASMDKNIYYAGVPGTQHLIYNDPTQSAQSLADYKALNVGKDQNSYTEFVPFVSATAPYDLHIDPTVPTYVEGNGIPLPTVLIDDIDGDIRDATTPDIGADEGDFTPYTGGVTLTAPTNVSIVLAGADIEISWDAVDGATGYYVYGSDLPYAVAPWGTPLATVNAPDTTTVLTPGSQFKFYYVSAFE